MDNSEEEESDCDLNLEEDDPFLFLLELFVPLVSMNEQAGSPASFDGVWIKSKTNPLSNFELSFPITRPTCSNSDGSIYIYTYNYIIVYM